MNWRIKAATQALLSVLPGGRLINERLQRLVGGRRPDSVKARVAGKLREMESMLNALDRAGVDPRGTRVLEIGTGWDPVVPVCMAGMGCRITTMDVRRNLKTSETVKLRLKLALGSLGGRVSFTEKQNEALQSFYDGKKDLLELLPELGVEYHAPVDDSTLLSFPPASFDLVYSIAVLEHVHPSDLEVLLRGQAHVLSEGAISYHDIGLGDHFADFDSSISFANFLQYDGTGWKWLGENYLSYHNRLRKSDFMRLFKSLGHQVLWSEHQVDPKSLEAMKSDDFRLLPRYADYETDDLATWRMAVVLKSSGSRKPAEATAGARSPVETT